MATATLTRILLVGRPSPWLDSATSHLREAGYDVDPLGDVDEAVARLRREPSIACAVLAEGAPRARWMDGLARMVAARPDLPVIVLAASYDPVAMAQYIRLGQRDSGAPLVSYVPNEYDYDRLASLIHNAHAGPVRPTDGPG